MLRKFKIQHRLIGTFLVVSVIPIIFLGYYAHKLYSESISEKLSLSTYQAITLLNKNLLTELQNYQYLSGSISTSSFIQENIADHALMTDVTLNSKEEAMDSIFRTIFPSHVVTVTVLDASQRPFYELGFETITINSIQQVIQSINKTAPYDSFTYVKTARSYDTIALGRKIHAEYDSSEHIGYVLVFFSTDLFAKQILSSINLGDGTKLLIMGQDGTVFASNDKRITIGERFEDETLHDSIIKKQNEGEQSYTALINGSKQQVSFIYNEQIGMYLISLMPYSYIHSEISQITVSTISIVLVIILICIIIIYFMNNSIVKPIKHIIAFTNQISNGDFSNRIKDSSEDEMSVLSRKINSMVEDLQQFMKTQKSDEKRKRELELQMLQSQINPHFLFNTLNTLKWLAVINRVPILNKGISSLSELLRSTILDNNEEITIEKEVENLNHYFNIQKIRYVDRFHVTYHIDEHLLSCSIPKFILQPVAENSIIHGISDQGKSLTININIYSVEELLYIEIVDNGKGFDVENIQKVEPKNKLSSIGIKNVRERIKLHYGDQYGLFISSVVGVGTTCQIIIPIREAKEHDS